MPPRAQLASQAEALPSLLTTHHLFKAFALVIMTIDHVGAFLYPDDLWWRAVGRIATPIWFFLVGYALVYRPRRDTALWALALMVISPFLVRAFFR